MAVDAAADAALDCYVQMYESLCEEQQVEALQGHPLRARKANWNAQIVRRAIDAEIRQPESQPDPYRLCCSTCTVWMATRGGR